MTNAGTPQTGAGAAAGTRARPWPRPAARRRANWRGTELWLMLFPALFLLFGLTILLIVNGQHIDLAAKTLPPAQAFLPVIGLMLALLGAHFALVFIAPDADQTLLPIAGMLSAVGVLMA
ncbi:MAG: hypothetical protein KGO05_13705, partial [Chloroflexota bacterium]|nr:hypothetical protein [Chloroflexota bacterium]